MTEQPSVVSVRMERDRSTRVDATVARIAHSETVVHSHDIEPTKRTTDTATAFMHRNDVVVSEPPPKRTKGTPALVNRERQPPCTNISMVSSSIYSGNETPLRSLLRLERAWHEADHITAQALLELAGSMPPSHDSSERTTAQLSECMQPPPPFFGSSLPMKMSLLDSTVKDSVPTDACRNGPNSDRVAHPNPMQNTFPAMNHPINDATRSLQRFSTSVASVSEGGPRAPHPDGTDHVTSPLVQESAPRAHHENGSHLPGIPFSMSSLDLTPSKGDGAAAVDVQNVVRSSHPGSAVVPPVALESQSTVRPPFYPHLKHLTRGDVMTCFVPMCGCHRHCMGNVAYHHDVSARHTDYTRASDEHKRIVLCRNVVDNVLARQGQFWRHGPNDCRLMDPMELEQKVWDDFRQPCIVQERKEIDLCLGRGAQCTHSLGHQQFLNQKDALRPAYLTATNNTTKTRVAQQLVDWVYARGGRILKEVAPQTNQWFIVENKEALHTVKQKLRECRKAKP